MAALARCVGDVERFLAEHWSRAPVLCRGADPHGFADLFSLDDVDAVIASSLPRVPEFRLVRDGEPLDPAAYTTTMQIGGRSVSGVGDPGRIFDEFAAGATIVLQTLHRWWAPLARFCRALELELQHPVQTNAYVTPAGSRGLAVHHDTHDVFVLQLAGHKHWDVYEPAVELPLPTQRWSKDRHQPGEHVLSAELGPGDVLYLPRGFAHSAASGDEVSAHLTVGVLVQTWADVARDLVRSVADDVEFRQTLPVGFASDPGFPAAVAAFVERLQKHVANVDAAALAEATTRRFWSSRPPILAGQLAQLALAERLSDRSVVRRRPEACCHLSLESGDDAGVERLVVALGDRELRMPAVLEAAVRRLSSGAAIEVADLAGELDADSRLVLVRRLVREGLLEVLDPPPTGL